MKCKPPAVTHSKIKLGSQTRTETSGKSSSYLKTIFLKQTARRQAHVVRPPRALYPSRSKFMVAKFVTIERASPKTLEGVLEILSKVDLPHDGVKDHFGGFLVARSGGRMFFGCMGLDRPENLGLFRPAPVL